MNSQVRAFGRFSTGRETAASSNPVLSEFRISTGPGQEPRTAAVAAFARSSQVLPRLTRRADKAAPPLVRACTGPGAVEHATAIVDFFAVDAPTTPVQAAVDLALYFLTVTGEDAAHVSGELRDHFRRTKVNLQPMDEDNLLTGTAVAILSALDSTTPIHSIPGWFGHGLKPTTKWRTGPVLAALFSMLLALAVAPEDGHDAYDVADVSDPRFVAYLREATEYVVDRALLPQFEGPFEDLVLHKDPRVHAKIIRVYEETRARVGTR